MTPMTVPFPVLVPVAFSVRHDLPIRVALADPAAVEILPVLPVLAYAVPVPILPVAAPAVGVGVLPLLPFGVLVPGNHTILHTRL